MKNLLLAQYLGLNFMNQMSTEHYLDLYNDLVIYLELIIACTVMIMILSIILNTWFQNVDHWIVLESIWTMSPSIVLLILGIPSIKMIYSLEYTNFFSNLSIKIVGYQWYWNYSFPEFEVEIDSYPKLMSDLFRMGESNLLVLPIYTNLRLLMTSNDVIHSWALPSISLKMDAVPGRLNMLSTKILSIGNYMGQCSELCGNYHSWMPIYAESTNSIIFNQWIKLLFTFNYLTYT
uniref:Cytochrome c oxidase subunit 2 n=1 Tax=Agamermis sp. BH-2006 TaxID=390897 RepID=Q0Z878_9BILA|nr:cytochrome c oxidase subunit II [Agamermis sp. BH-2006]ABG38303.1 cytochrome c oxidase subunit II [Agamermis sp. BH-2006]